MKPRRLTVFIERLSAPKPPHRCFPNIRRIQREIPQAARNYRESVKYDAVVVAEPPKPWHRTRESGSDTTKLSLRRPTEVSSKETLCPLAGFCSSYSSCS